MLKGTPEDRIQILSDAMRKRRLDQFEQLYAQSQSVTRVMAISMHPYLTGAPHRIKYLERIYEHILTQPGVVMWTGEQILDWFLSQDGGRDRAIIPN